MRFFSEVLKYFAMITTGILLIFIAVLYFYGAEDMPRIWLAEIPVIGLVTALITAAVLRGEAVGGVFIAKLILHFVLICLVVVPAGVSFGWVDLSANGIATMVLCTAGVYVFTYTMTYLSSKREAEKLNSALKRKRTIH